MSRRKLSRLLVFLTAIAVVAAAPFGSAAEEAIRRALDQPVSVDFVDSPLETVAAFLADTCGVPIVLDQRGLYDVGLAPNVPVSLRVSQVKLDSALGLLLRDLDLTYMIGDGVLLVTTPEEAETRLTVRVYPCGDLVGSAEEAGVRLDRLVAVITSCVEPTTWEAVGGPGSIAAARFRNIEAVVIRQTWDVHEEVAALLEGLRVTGKRVGGEKEQAPILLYDGRYAENPPAEKIRKVLSKKVCLDFDEEPLEDVVEFIEQTFKIPCQIDARALDDVGLSTATPMTSHVSGLSLRSALNVILRPLDLTWAIRDEVLLVTAPEEAEMMRLAGIYPVGDLAVCRDENDEPWYDYGSLAQMIVKTVEQEAWDDVGGPGTIEGGTFGRAHVLVISQTLPVHEQVAKLLADLRAVAADAPQDAPPPRRSKSPPPACGVGFF